MLDGRRREIGLGSVLKVSLASARERAAELSATLGEGKDPLGVREAEQRAAEAAAAAKEPFGLFADRWFETSVAPGLENDKHISQWKHTLGDPKWPETQANRN